MAQWMNLYWKNGFVNRMRLPLLCEKSGAILLVLVGIAAVQQSDTTLADLNFLKFSTDRISRMFMAFNRSTVLL